MPSAPITTAHTTSPPAAPKSAARQDRVKPTATTMAIISMTSIVAARKVDAKIPQFIAGHHWARWDERSSPSSIDLQRPDRVEMIGAVVGHAKRSQTLAAPPVRAGGKGLVRRADLFERLAEAGRVTVVSAPPGSGKTVLLRSWIDEAGLSDSTAWVSLGRDGPGAQVFWISLLDALRGTVAGSTVIRELTPAPGLDEQTIVEGLLEDVRSLEDRLWLVIDGVHELGSDALRELALFALRAPPNLRLVLLTRR